MRTIQTLIDDGRAIRGVPIIIGIGEPTRIVSHQDDTDGIILKGFAKSWDPAQLIVDEIALSAIKSDSSSANYSLVTTNQDIPVHPLPLPRLPPP